MLFRVLGALALCYRWNPADAVRTMTPVELVAYHEAALAVRAVVRFPPGPMAYPAPMDEPFDAPEPAPVLEGIDGLRALFGGGK